MIIAHARRVAEMVATVVTAGKVDKVENEATAANLATEELAVTAVKVETAAKVEIAFLSYNIISLLCISRRGRCVFTYNAR